MKFWKSLLLLPLLLLVFSTSNVEAKTGRYRLVWQDDPSTTMVVGWDQISGNGGKVYYDVVDHGAVPTEYAFSKNPATTVQAKGMSNHFVHLSGLRPNTVYYFVVADTEGASRVLSFKTAPKKAERLSIVAGSDSRNHRTARVDANKMVSKLRPHCVMFGGDFTENDSDTEWVAWFDDWQHTISKDGRMYPIIPARGNHEYSNKTLIQLFDVKYKGINYALTLGGDLLRIYTLNSMVASGGEQRSWLKRDLASHPDVTWKTAQYHLSTRPHCAKKNNNNDQWGNWSKLFFEYKINLVVESDAHTVKSTYPLRPTTEAGSEEGFIRDDENGTVYVGEGCWGAPLRRNDNPKKWTRAAGSFNSFHWIFVDQGKMEVRFVKTDGADNVAEVNPNNIFMMPRGINIWNPPTGDVITIEKSGVEFLYKGKEKEAQVATKPKPKSSSKPKKAVASTSPSVEGKFKIIDLKINQRGQDILVDWKTVNEPEAVKFAVFRALNNQEYKIIKTVKGSKKGSYRFVDLGFAVHNPDTQVKYKVETVKGNSKPPPKNNPREKPKPKINKKPSSSFPILNVDKSSFNTKLNFVTKRPGLMKARLLKGRELIKEWPLKCPKPGKQLSVINFSGVPNGPYVLVIFNSAGKPLEKYRVNL